MRIHIKSRKTLLYIIYSALIPLFSLFITSSASATNMSASVGIRPSMTFSISVSDVSMSLNPATKPFDTKNIPITVGTNNPTGYQVFVNATGTDLINTDDSSETIPTLTTSGAYDTTSFPADYWGYKINTGNYTPFVSGNVVSSAAGPINEKTDNMTVAAKIDYLQPQGTYEIALNFSILPIVSTNYMQEMQPSECTETPMTIADQRDGIPYTVRRLPDGNCWMTDNLRFTGTKLSSATSNVAAQYTDANPYLVNGTGAYKSLSVGDNSYDDAELIAGTDNNGDPTVWYNYAAATAGTITGNINADPARYDICPSGWRLPTYAEQGALITALGTDKTIFNIVTGGYYSAGTAHSATESGLWWASTVGTSYQSSTRGRIGYYQPTDDLNASSSSNRGTGIYVRCILDTRTIADITNLQDVTPAISRNTTIGTTANLIDVRDGQTYKVAKLADNRLWMLDNLRLGATTLAQPLSTANTNMSPSVAFTLPASSSSGFSTFTTPLINTTYANTVATTTYGSGSNKMGTYFNYCAATAGTICTEIDTSNARYDVCPAGWRMPTSNPGGEYQVLYSNYSTKADFMDALSTPFSGSIRNNSFTNQNIDGTYWGSTYSSFSGYSQPEGAFRYGLIVANSGSTIDPHREDYSRRNGFVVRCVAR